MANLIVRDVADYPDATEPDIRASLPEQYAQYPYAGVWKLSGEGEAWVHVFTTDTAEDLAGNGWIKQA